MADDDRNGDEDTTIIRHEEEATGVSKSWRGAGYVRARKRVDTVRESQIVPREREEMRFERVPAAEGDSGKIETLEDGSVSIPVYEEELVVTKRTVLKERVVVRKEIVTEQERVSAKLRKERVDVEGDEGIRVAGEPRAEDDGRRSFIETRPFFLTSEFLALLAVVAGVAISIAISSLTLTQGLALIVAILAAYFLSRGFAKARTPSESWDPRTALVWRARR
jgi:uncharacterized protein (TIGR02271 family)